MIHNKIIEKGERRPVLLFGGSYTACNESQDCFEEILNQDILFNEQHYLLNYAVPGYGIDQICLLLNETVTKYTNPFVVISLSTTDIDKSMLEFSYAPKPHYVLNNGKLQLKGNPVKLNAKQYLHRHPLKVKSYLWNWFRTGILSHLYTDYEGRANYIRKAKSLNRAILKETFRKLDELNIEYIVILFHPEHLAFADWRLVFLRHFCENNRVHYVCDVDMINSDISFSEYSSSNYKLPTDGYPTSHLNKLISAEIKNYLLNPEYYYVFLNRNQNWLEKISIRSEEYFKEKIINSPRLSRAVKRKAMIQLITVDSMINVEAKRMAKEEFKTY